MDEHQLEHKWIMFDHKKGENHNYEENTRKIGTFDTVEGFWRLFNNYPSIEDIFYQTETGKPLLGNRAVASISIFKEGIQPRWEDRMNAEGGDIALKKYFHNKANTSPLNYFANTWQELAMAVIGGSFALDGDITGIRVVDSSVMKKSMYRIEIWFSTLSSKDSVEVDFRRLLNIDPSVSLHHNDHAWQKPVVV